MSPRVLVAVAVCAGLSACIKQDATDADRSLCVTQTDFEAYGFKPGNGAAQVEVSRYRRFDGSVEVRCRVNTRSASGGVLFIDTNAEVTVSPRRAVTQQVAGKMGVEIGLKAGGMSIQDVPGVSPYGDEADFSLLIKNDKPVGNFYSVRDGSKVYRVMVMGPYFQDPKTWDKLIHAKLELLKTYDPD